MAGKRKVGLWPPLPLYLAHCPGLSQAEMRAFAGLMGETQADLTWASSCPTKTVEGMWLCLPVGPQFWVEWPQEDEMWEPGGMGGGRRLLKNPALFPGAPRGANSPALPPTLSQGSATNAIVGSRA